MSQVKPESQVRPSAAQFNSNSHKTLVVGLTVGANDIVGVAVGAGVGVSVGAGVVGTAVGDKVGEASPGFVGETVGGGNSQSSLQNESTHIAPGLQQSEFAVQPN